MRKLRLLPLSTYALTLLACSQPMLSNYPYQKEPDPRRAEYVIGVSDNLRIRVWKNPELNTDIQVRPDGTLTMPLIGDVRADGLTPSQLRNEIRQRLGVYIKDEAAIVTVAVTEANSYSVTVSGNVAQPGVFTSRQYLTVADAIALAGGPTRFANPDDAVLIRSDGRGGVRRIPINYTQIAKGVATKANLVLMRGDALFVP
ncbi:MAG: polysaccharide export protein [Polyangiaceae bacterium]|jgi:polysaccharide export outer membrane protein|nr:polysaccharide export protein [Polyangiaceae bacterium]